MTLDFPILLGREHNAQQTCQFIVGRGTAKGAVGEPAEDVMDSLLPLNLGVLASGPARNALSTRGDRTGALYFRNASGKVSAGGFMIRSRDAGTGMLPRSPCRPH